MKKCSKCKKEKEITEFSKCRSGRPTSHCKSCVNEYSKIHYKKKHPYRGFRVPLLVDDFGTVLGKICSQCKDLKLFDQFNDHPTGVFKKGPLCKPCKAVKYKEWRIKNKEQLRKSKKAYKARPEIRKQTNKWQRTYRKNPLIKLHRSVSSRVLNYLKNINSKKNKTTEEIIGCSKQELRQYLESTFEANYGIPREWMESFNYHVDHIIPIMTAKTEEEVYKLNHYTNLQILLAEDNLKKSNKLNYTIGD